MRPGPLAIIAREQGIESHEFSTSHRYRDLPTVVRGIHWLIKLAKNSQAALFHSTHTAHLYASPAAKWLGVPEVWHHHDRPSPGFDLVQTVNRRLPTTHAIFTTKAVAAAYPWLTRRPHSVIAPVCVDPAALAAHRDAADVRERLGIPPGDLLLTVARLQEHKGHSDLLDAAAVVLASHPGAVFGIVGKASTPEQTAYLASLREQATRLGIADRVVFTGFVSDADLASLYRRAIAMVHPARSEGYGLVLLEAMGMGLPVIAAAADGPRELLIDDTNGLLTPVADALALAVAVRRLLSDAGLRDRLKTGGRSTATDLAANDMLRQTTDVFQHLRRQTMHGFRDRSD